MKELRVAMSAAREAGALIMKYYGKSFKVRHKGQINLVTEVDEKAQAKIQKVILKHFPKDVILGEEGDLSETQSAARRWIVDPIDGTTNFAHGYPKFCVSIAFEKNSRAECGVIYDPVMKEMFHAKRGGGAFLNSKRIKCSTETQLKKALLVTGFPYDLYDPKANNLPYFNKMIYKAQAIRRDGSAALNLAYVACGRFDGFWELTLNAWDVAAGILLVEEAGGKIRLITKELHHNYPRHFVAANPSLCNRIWRQLRGDGSL